MKVTKKFLAAMLSVMLLAMIPMTVFAEPASQADGATITVTRSDTSIDMTKRSFNLYRIFSAAAVGTGIQYSWINTADETQDAFYPFFFDPSKNNGTARVTTPEYGTTIDAVVRYINQQNTSAATMAQFSHALLSYITAEGISAETVTPTKTPTSIVYTGLPLGYYLIEDKTDISADEGEVISSLMLTTSTKEATVELKATRPTIDKFVYDVNDVLTDPTNKVGTKGASASIGDTVTYRMAVLIPDVSTYTNGYFFTINDTQGDGMPYVTESFKLYTVDAVSGDKAEVLATAADNSHMHWAVIPQTYTEFEEKMTSDSLFAQLVNKVLTGTASVNAVTEATYNTYFNGGVLVIDLYGHDDNQVFSAGDMLEIYCDAVVGEGIFNEDNPETTEVKEAATEFGNSTNTVVLNYTSNPSAPMDDLGTASSSAQVWTHDFKLLKKSADSNGQATGIGLNGAQFNLYENGSSEPLRFLTEDDVNYCLTTSDDPSVYTTVLKTNSAGETKIYGIGAGVYRLVEIKAPEGYTLPTEGFDFTIEATIGSVYGDLTSMKISSSSTSVVDSSGMAIPVLTGFSFNDDTNGYVEAVLTNIPAEALPATGGMGTTLFTVAGIILMIGAGSYLVINKKRNHK